MCACGSCESHRHDYWPFGFVRYEPSEPDERP